MNKLVLIVLTLVIAGCRQNGQIKVSKPITLSKGAASGAYFTKDHRGNSVLCWTAGERGTEHLVYSIYNRESRGFGQPVLIPAGGINVSPETMNKIAFKDDGTIVAVFAQKHPTPRNKFAGSLMFTQSFDNGLTWTNAKFVHTDTLRDNSRSYFDLATLPDGEVAIVWLDGRLRKGKDGSSLFFAKTNGTNGFLADKILSETVCQCCRTDIYVDVQSNIHVVYRDVESRLEGQVRDFAHIASDNNGDTFTAANKISNDNWLVDGCPHTGASLSSCGNKLQACWFTAAGVPGLYFSESDNRGVDFAPRQLVSETGRHPQLAAVGEQLVMVWQEAPPDDQARSGHHAHHSEGTNGGGIIFSTKGSCDNLFKKISIDSEGEFPVVTTTGNKGILVAYTKSDRIIVRHIEL